MIIRLKNGDEKTLYFDITEFYNFYKKIYSNFKKIKIINKNCILRISFLHDVVRKDLSRRELAGIPLP